MRAMLATLLLGLAGLSDAGAAKRPRLFVPGGPLLRGPWSAAFDEILQICFLGGILSFNLSKIAYRKLPLELQKKRYKLNFKRLSLENSQESGMM